MEESFSKDGVEVAMPTVRIPGYIIAIRAPDYLILQAVDIEKLLIFFSILSLILILFLGLQGFFILDCFLLFFRCEISSEKSEMENFVRISTITDKTNLGLLGKS